MYDQTPGFSLSDAVTKSASSTTFFSLLELFLPEFWDDFDGCHEKEHS